MNSTLTLLHSLYRQLRHSANQGFYLFLCDYGYYYQLSYLGYFWTLLKPLLSTLPVVIVGTQLGFVPQNSNLGYLSYATSGLLCWMLFWDGVSLPMSFTRRTRRILGSTPVLPSAVAMASCLGALIDFFVCALFLLAATLYEGSLNLQNLPLVLTLMPIFFLFGLSIGLPLAAFSSVYQDFQMGIGLMGQALFWATPFVHQASLDSWLFQLNLYNPLAQLVELFRKSLFNAPPSFEIWAFTSIFVALGAFIVGYLFYKRSFRLSLEYVL